MTAQIISFDPHHRLRREAYEDAYAAVVARFGRAKDLMESISHDDLVGYLTGQGFPQRAAEQAAWLWRFAA